MRTQLDHQPQHHEAMLAKAAEHAEAAHAQARESGGEACAQQLISALVRERKGIESRLTSVQTQLGRSTEELSFLRSLSESLMQNEGAWEAEIEAARAELRDIEAATERQVCHHFDYGGGGSYCWGGSSQGAAFPGGAARGEAVGADAQARWRHGRGR